MPELTREQYDRFVNPRAIAVVGVSERTGPQAYNLVENLEEAGCTCRIYPVNVRAAEIAGRKAYRSILDIPEPVDLAVVSTEPGSRGDTASGGTTKPATLETGLQVRVPLFIKEGEMVRVSTETGEFAGRA